jgi:outer membrane protein assembly factor BamA
MKTFLLMIALVLAEAQAQSPVIRSIQYLGFKEVKAEEIASRFKDRDVRVALEQTYDQAQVDKARTVLQEMLTEKGRNGVEVKSTARHLPPKSVEVIFQAVDNQ